jgi:hypothetical protein
MEILANPSDWTPNDEEQLARFLETPTGKRLVPKLSEGLPSLLEGGEINAILIRSGQVLAWNKMIESLFLLAHPAPSVNRTVSEEYPALENDKAWNDGQQLEPIPNSETQNQQ